MGRKRKSKGLPNILMMNCLREDSTGGGSSALLQQPIGFRGARGYDYLKKTYKNSAAGMLKLICSRYIHPEYWDLSYIRQLLFI